MSLKSDQNKKTFGTQLKKSNSFFMTSKPSKSVKLSGEQKALKKRLNISDFSKKPTLNSKSSFNKTSVTIESQVQKPKVKAKGKKKVNVRDYLIMNQQIYQCPNIEQINERLISRDNSIYSPSRFIKLTLKNQEKLQKYLNSFKEFIQYEKRTKIDLSAFSTSQKAKLYNLLRSETLEQRKVEKKSVKNPQIQLESLLKQMTEKIDKKSEEIIREKPQLQSYVKIWRSQKLHELLRTNQYLESEQNALELSEDQTSFENDLLNQKSRKNINVSTKPFQIDEKVQEQADYQIKPMKALEISNNCKEKQLQVYTNEVYKQKIQQESFGKTLQPTSFFSDLGIQNFLQDLWNFMIDEELIEQLMSRIKVPYGLTQNEKQLLINKGTRTGEQWSAYITTKMQPVLGDHVFISFCKNLHGASPSSISAEEQKYLILFYKAVFDALNTQLSKYQTDFPYGIYHPLEKNINHSRYVITEDNVMSLWDQCLNNILQINRVGAGSPIHDPQQRIKADDKWTYECLKFEESECLWERTQPLATRKVITELFKQIQRELILEMVRFF